MKGAFVTTSSSQKVVLGVPQAQNAARESGESAFKDICLEIPGTASEASSSILAVMDPLFSYVSGQKISITGGRNF